MSKKSALLYKTLVVGIIILFIGIGMQPVIAITNNGNNNSPEAPTITGPIRGKPWVKYAYQFCSNDPEDDNVSYYIEWGDGTTTGWTDYYPSGIEVAISHTWKKIDWDNLLRAKAKDIHGGESDWSTRVIPINKVTVNHLFLRFLERFPLLERLLNLIRFI